MKLNINYQPSKNMKVKIKSYLKNTKSDNAIKLSNLEMAHGRTVRYGGKTYRINVATLGKAMYISAESLQGKEPAVNFGDDSPIAKDLKKLCENRLYS
jgi:hypothetical protein